MKSYDFDAVAYDGAIYCVGCLPEGVDAESDDVYPVFADSEWDCYPVCDACHAEHDYVNLTSDGWIWKRERNWSAKMKETARECRANHVGGNMPMFAWPGGYTIVYYSKEGDEFCANCANNVDKEIQLEDCGIYWEGPTIQCAECGDDIDSSYGDPDAEETT